MQSTAVYLPFIAMGLICAPLAFAQNDALGILRHQDIDGAACHSDDDPTTTVGCCGAPGVRGCSHLPTCTNPASNALRTDSFGGFPVTLCNLPDPVFDKSALGSEVPNPTFYVTSDLHFFRPGFKPADQVRHVAEINRFAEAKEKWPTGLGIPDTDTIAPPLGVILAGDLTLDASSGNLGAFRLLWERGTHAESIKYPVYVGLGNHDMYTQASPVGALRMFWYLGRRMSNIHTIDASPEDPNFDSAGRHGGSGNYYWNWGKLRVFQLNTWAGESCNTATVADGLAWLKSSLEGSVGISGAPVVVVQHYPSKSATLSKDCNGDQTWTVEDVRNFWNIIRDYNVVGLFAGHTHQVAAYRTSQYVSGLDSSHCHNGNCDRKVLDEFVSGTGGEDARGDFIVARVSDNYLDVIHRRWNYLGAYSNDEPGYYNNLPGCRKRINSRFVDVNGLVAISETAGAKRTVTLKLKDLSTPLPGPLALKIEGLHTAYVLAEKSFVDSCGVSTAADPNPTSPLVLLTDSQVEFLNGGGSVAITLTFNRDPGSLLSMLKLVTLPPLRGVQPDGFNLTGSAKAQTLVAYGPPGEAITVTVKFEGGNPPWLTLTGVPKTYDQFGRAAITFAVDSAQAGRIGVTTSASMQIATDYRFDLNTLTVNLSPKATVAVSLDANPPSSSASGAVFEAKLAYDRQIPLSIGECCLRLDGFKVTLYNRVTDPATKAVTDQALTSGRVNASGCDVGTGSTWPHDTVIFGDVGGDHPCASSGLAAGDRFLFGVTPKLAPGRYQLFARFDGLDSAFTSADSPVISYRLGPNPAKMDTFAGDYQSAIVGTAYTGGLAVRVLDAAGNPTSGVEVRFDSGDPAVGPGGAFDGGSPTVTVYTDSNGIARSTKLTANSVPGLVRIIATASGLATPVEFLLINRPVPPPPAIFSSRRRLDFLAGASNAKPVPAAITVTTEKGPAAAFAAVADQPWISVTPTSGATNAATSLTVAVNSTGLAPGAYVGTVALSAPGYSRAEFVVVLKVSASTGALLAAAPYRVGQGPGAVAAGDLNRDGKPDLAIANGGDGTVTVLLAAGDGTFAPAPGSPFDAGPSPYGVVIGDFNGDGLPDLAVANGATSRISILTGYGNGAFSSPAAVTAGAYPASLAALDIGGDGLADLAVANQDSDSVTILRQSAAGLAEAAGSPYATGTRPRSIATADFNGDGYPDLAIANDGSANVTVLLGDAKGAFVAATGSPFAAGKGAARVVAGDFNGDNAPDLAVTDPAMGTVTVLLNDGAAGFRALAPIDGGPNATALTAADLDGDGRLDLAVSNYVSPGSLTVLLGDGSGGFSPAASSPLVTGAYPGGYTFAAADFNGDGRTGIAIANGGDASLTVLAGAPSARTVTTLDYSTGESWIPARGSVTVTARVSVTGNLLPLSGQVQFLDGSAVLRNVDLTAGVAVLNLTQPPAGLHHYAAEFVGSPRLAASRSGAFTLLVVAEPAALDDAVGPLAGVLPDGTEYRQVLGNAQPGERHTTADHRQWIAVQQIVVDGKAYPSIFSMHWMCRN